MANRYLVTWEIDAEADTPEQAAREAWETMRRPGSTANVFVVVDEHGDQVTVDLQEAIETSLSLMPNSIGDIVRTMERRF